MINQHMFYDIMKQMIIDDIRNDEITNKKTNDIIRKLNIWFSLWDFFSNNKSNNLKMASKILQHQKRIREIRESKSDSHIQIDEEFAFAVGQIIYYLLSKSRAGELTHAALEPFLQKTDSKELKKTIANTINAYKHEIDFGQGRFEKLASEIMDYDLDGNLKDLMPIILAGYFSKSLIYEKSEKNESKELKNLNIQENEQ